MTVELLAMLDAIDRAAAALSSVEVLVENVVKLVRLDWNRLLALERGERLARRRHDGRQGMRKSMSLNPLR
jgi:hypothetical protein